MNFMKNSKNKAAVAEDDCPECNGSGFQAVVQPIQPGRKLYPPRCKKCLGKGRLARH
jgi:DnaJ-class molecular chaperone